MWEITFLIKTGQYHLEQNMLCQDQVYYQENNQSQVIVLADGIGDNDHNVECVRQVIEYTADQMLKLSGQLWSNHIDRNEFIKTIISGVVRIISKNMDRWNLPAACFGSTLMAFLIDSAKEQYLLLHLGDGIIWGKDKESVRVLSYPSGNEKHETFLTISENILERVKLRMGELGDLEQIVLCSDGMYESPVNKDYIENKIYGLVEKMEELPMKEDDQSMIQLRRKNDGIDS